MISALGFIINCMGQCQGPDTPLKLQNDFRKDVPYEIWRRHKCRGGLHSTEVVKQ